MTSQGERVRPVKERVGSSARDGDGEGGTNDVYASRIFSSRLGRPDGFGCSLVGHAVLYVPLEEGHRIRVRISASLKRERNQCAVREIVGRCVFGYFPFVSSRGREPCRLDGTGGAATRGIWVRDDKVPKKTEIILVSLRLLPKHTAPSTQF